MRLKGWKLWVVTALAGAVLGMLGFSASTQLVQVDANADSITFNCLARNEQLERINRKFQSLDRLIDASIRQSSAEGRPTHPDVIRAYEEYREPIPIVDCEEHRTRE